MSKLTATAARVSVLFLLLTVVVTWPLTLHLGDQVIGPFHGDNLEYIWKIWWVEHAVVDLRQSPLIQPDVHYPHGYSLAYGEITPIHTYLGIPLTALFGPVVTYNLFILVSAVLGGLFTFLLVRELTASTPAGVVAGVVFAFCPYRMARIAGNLPLVDTHWLPLFFLFLERFIRRWSDEQEKRELMDAAAMGLAFSAAVLSSWYYGVVLGLLAPIYLAARIRSGWRTVSWRRAFRAGLVFVATAGILILPFLLPYMEIQQAGAARVPLEQAAFWSANLSDFVLPNPRHVIWGDWVQRNLTPFPEGLPYEFLVGWGLLPSILALYGWRRGRLAAKRAWGWLSLFALVLSLGPVLKVLGAVITLPAPAALAASINDGLNWLGRHSLASEPFALAPDGRIAIPLPALLLRWFVPGLAGMRSWGRFAILATLGVAVLAGAGTAAFLRTEVETRPSRRPNLRRWRATGLLAGLIFFEFYTGPQQLITPGPRPVDEWLADRPGRVTILQMPLAVALSGPQMFYTMHHGQRIASGYGTYFPILFESWYPELQAFPADEAMDLLASWGGEGVEFVLIDEADVPAAEPLWDAVAAQDRLQLTVVVGGVHVYRVR